MDNNELYFPSFRFISDLKTVSGWEKIFQGKESKKFPKKSVIVRQGQKVNCIYFIVSGLVEYTYVREDGTQELLEVLGDGNLFCLQPMFGRNPAVGSFIALEDSVISEMSAEELDYYLQQDISLAKELLGELANIIGGLMRRLYAQTLPADQRVGEAIYLLAEYKKKKVLAHQQIFISLAQDDLARISGTTRVTVTKVLRELKKLSLIETAYGGIVVLDLQGLKDLLPSAQHHTLCPSTGSK